MTLRCRVLPAVPKGVVVSALAPNLKLFSDAEIAAIKARFTENGRYRTYVDEQGVEQELKYPVFVFNGKYFASYPGKLFLMGESSFGKIKAAQNLDSGEWVPEKVVSVKHGDNQRITSADVRQEAAMLKAAKLAVTANDEEVVSFHRPFSSDKNPHAEFDQSVSTEEKFFGGSSNYFHEDFILPPQPEDESGKYYLFMQRASGKNLEDWLTEYPAMPTIVKMDISISLVRAVMALHDQQILHRDIKPSNLVFDMFKGINQAMTLVDFGLAVKMENSHQDLIAGQGTSGYAAPETRKRSTEEFGKYSVKSDIYALGVTLDALWNHSSNVTSNKIISTLVGTMTQVEPDKRPDLEKVLSTLSSMKDRLKHDERILKICMLEIDEFYDACDGGTESLERHLKDLASYDQIRLYDSANEACVQELLAIKQKLESRHITVSDQVFIGPVDVMKNFVEKNQNKLTSSGRVYQIKLMAQQIETPIYTMSEDFVVLEISNSPEPRPVDGEPLIDLDEHENNTYNVGSCLAWFFSSLWQDIRHMADRPHHHHQAPDNGCFGLFSRRPSPPPTEAERRAMEADNNLDEETGRLSNMV